MNKALLVFLIISGAARAQEAPSGFDLRATITGQANYDDKLTDAPRNGSPVSAGFRSMLYPTIKLNDHWSILGAFQTVTRPYGTDDSNSIGYGARGRVISLNLSWVRSWKNRSVMLRTGQMLSAFGSFSLRYDDMDNPLTGMPVGYSYYGPVSVLGVAGAQADITLGKWDGRVQFANSSPANPRGIFGRDQYANWAGGLGYTVRQGFRVGSSAYRGPYLDRGSPYFLPGEANPRELPATGLGVDAEWARGHWNIRGEVQHFVFAYRAVPNFREAGGYAEIRRVLNPRWFVAGRAGYLHTTYAAGANQFEAAIGFRPNTRQLVKVGYTICASEAAWKMNNVLTIQLVSALHLPPLAWR